MSCRRSPGRRIPEVSGARVEFLITAIVNQKSPFLSAIWGKQNLMMIATVEAGWRKIMQIVPRRLHSMSAITRDEVKNLAHLARIEVSETEVDQLHVELNAMVDSLGKVSEAAAAAGDVSPLSHPVAMTNVLRPDSIVPSLPVEQALQGAPEVEEQRFGVPQIMGEEP